MDLPTGFEMSQNYPNPFNPTTTIELSVPYQTAWSLTVYNISGQAVKVFNGNSQAGTVTVEWDGRNEIGESVASGIYFYRFDADSFSNTKKMILLK